MNDTSISNESTQPPVASMRLVAARDRKPMTSKTPVGIRVLNRRGAHIVLDTPFIDGLHVLMDVHNTTPKFIEVFFPGENPETHKDLALLGDIESYQREEDQKGVRFVLEVVWLDDGSAPALHDKDLKRLIRLLKKDPHSLGAH
jgi:hypothetical protein